MEQHLKEENGIFTRGTCRITLLTDRLVRLETAPGGQFEDEPTQRIRCRDFPFVSAQTYEHGEKLEIITEFLRITWDWRQPALEGVTIRLRGNFSTYHSLWRYGESVPTLGGTARTLDKADGSIPLEEGLMNRYGLAILDDSESPVLHGERYIPRKPGVRDVYFWGYGHDYRRCLRDYFRLTGFTPMLPRFALGNWWSRFYPYTQESYLSLMDRFKEKELPFSVAVLDMDWHVTNPPAGYGSGWTGYTWNRERFPEPEALLSVLHERGLRVTLNLHPAEGVRPFEEAYPAMARAMGMDPEGGMPIDFDLSDSRFTKAYFERLHHPLEEQGVDFWWIDWQQGDQGADGVDPLWALNERHYEDSRLRHGRGLIFSRYAGPGSHRYPIGFSGDTYISWASLDFQPYFTLTASNIGYCWWSHDIGGHMHGAKDEELMTRWVQFGVFSPIMRLHSSNNEFSGKEPWRFGREAEGIISDFLRLRHALIPYLFNMNRALSRDGRAPIEPMYYGWPDEKAAYQVKNQYMFGPDLLVCPITSPMDRETAAAQVRAWLPEGRWIDFFDGTVYAGGRMLTLHRALDRLPVLARAGAVIPMADLRRFTNSTENPAAMELRVFAGAGGACVIEEDGGNDQTAARTSVHWDWESGVLSIEAAKGDLSCLPKERGFLIRFMGVAPGPVLADGVETACRYDGESRSLTVELPAASCACAREVRLPQPALAENDACARAYRVLDRARIAYDLKSDLYKLISGGADMAQLMACGLSPRMLSALAEALCARG